MFFYVCSVSLYEFIRSVFLLQQGFLIHSVFIWHINKYIVYSVALIFKCNYGNYVNSQSERDQIALLPSCLHNE